MQKNAFVIAGVSSGSGKTTVTLGLMAALKKRGLTVQPFKTGPDYIDPSHHTAVCGRPSYNLDTWMMGEEGVKASFSRAMTGADVGIVEGVMGLFDGKGGQNIEGSTAHLVKLLGIPVILVVDVAGMAGSVAAVVSGFERFDPILRIAGVIFNRVGSERHFAMLKEAVQSTCKSKVLGYLPKDSVSSIPARHLGLFMAEESGGDEYIPPAGVLENSINLDELLACCGIGELPDINPPANESSGPVTIAVARDKAFCFYYEENLDILEEAGARIEFFSPLEDNNLPEGTAGIYIGGGYPELYAEALSGNKALRDEVRAAAEGGMPVYAECGGLMFLGKALTDLEGNNFEMAGLFPWVSRMLKKRRSLGYREVTAVDGCPFMGKGQKIRGHEFHYSEIESDEEVGCAYLVSDGQEKKEGYLYKNSLASYVHLHFASNPKFAEGFVNQCRKRQNNSTGGTCEKIGRYYRINKAAG